MTGRGKGAVLLLHGLYGNPQQLQYIGRKLNVRGGYSVCIPTLTGYSSFDAPTPRQTACWTDWIEQAEERFDQLRSEHEQVSVAGLCVGAALSLVLATRRSARMHALCLYSTPLRYDGWNVTWMRWFKFLGYYSPARFMVSLAERPPYGLKDERIRRWVATQFEQRGSSALGSVRSPLTGVVESERLMKHIRSRLHQVTVPTLIMHALEDDLASPRNADRIERGIASHLVRKVLLNNCYHIITMDFEKERVAQETLAFIAQAGSVSSSAAGAMDLRRTG